MLFFFTLTVYLLFSKLGEKSGGEMELHSANHQREEPCYAGVPMSTIVEQGFGVGDVISLLWFKRSLPRYCTQFIEICIMLCADHWSLCLCAHNTIVTFSKGGKDLVSASSQRLLTIGPRFGGAIDDAARYFKDAYDKGLSPYEFVEGMKKKGIRVPEIGHSI
ncbi:ATP-citrate synthase beta chain protein 2 [Cinnamomum micranthum f. kanehirae]|uniref:ATP-citrate synthase beta chain protein 2 n=1 Tax=Cinnamomum micranthum f. kanehirae TaxID=337451 RepID=A0A3S3NMU6_9MAGN|nr:ATP-citrate synthase beta chain protein 2 [Cinnamomum micranthum f. kanehirae]